MNLEEYKLQDIPATVYYVSNFITEAEESQIIKNVNSVPKPKWTCLSNRRLQDYGGIPHEKGMVPEKIPEWLQKYMCKIDELSLFEGRKANQVLVNEYLPGQGIMPHTDGPLFYPTITTISCGSHTVLEFLENNEQRKTVCEVLLEQRSLVVVKDDMYKKYLHSIRENICDNVKNCVNLRFCDTSIPLENFERNIRLSLTIRNVPKVLKLKLFG